MPPELRKAHHQNDIAVMQAYDEILLKTEKDKKNILRFNLKAFKNNYNLVDLSKMKLTYYGIKVGTCSEDNLSIDKLNAYDIVLAGVIREKDGNECYYSRSA